MNKSKQFAIELIKQIVKDVGLTKEEVIQYLKAEGEKDGKAKALPKV